MTNHDVKTAVYKQQEFSRQANRGAIARRAEVEGVVQAVLYENGCQDVDGLLKKQLKKMTDGLGGGGELQHFGNVRRPEWERRHRRGDQ